MTDLRRTASRIIEKMRWTRAFRRRREAAEQGNELAQKFLGEPTAPGRLSVPNGDAPGSQAAGEELIRGSQIRTVLQPIVDLRTGSVMGWEALSRGPSGTHLHEPLEMFAAAKDLSFELALDRHRCSAAVSSARGLLKNAKLFINIRPYLIYYPYYPSLVEIFEQQGVEGERIVLEISERYAIKDYATFVEAKKSFTDSGFQMAIDNIGAGHSGLERWANLQPDYVKFCSQLVRDIDTNYIKREMTRALKTLADRIGSSIIATGVEREGELKVLQEMGVEYGQGGLLGRPLDTPGSGGLGPLGEPTH